MVNARKQPTMPCFIHKLQHVCFERVKSQAALTICSTKVTTTPYVILLTVSTGS